MSLCSVIFIQSKATGSHPNIAKGHKQGKNANCHYSIWSQRMRGTNALGANTAETRTLNCCHIDHFPFRCLGCGRTRWGADHLCQLVTMARSSVTSTWHSRDSDKPLHLHNLVMPLLRNLQTLLTAKTSAIFSPCATATPNSRHSFLLLTTPRTRSGFKRCLAMVRPKGSER